MRQNLRTKVPKRHVRNHEKSNTLHAIETIKEKKGESIYSDNSKKEVKFSWKSTEILPERWTNWM